jgi:2-polyprenyl-3-methyl-5-hydroxy-6-metoxy-1,4-benzoquinol methylase
VIDLGSSPASNAYLSDETIHAPEKWFPLRVLVCEKCWLVQTEDYAQADELFNDRYAYFSSFSTSWLQHAKLYVSNMIERFIINEKSHVIEVASNDGYLLQYFDKLNIPCTGIEPTNSTATAARDKGITVVEEFFGVKLANKLMKQNKQADLMVANNVLAHVPDINDFVSGFTQLLKPNGVATFEFPHLLNLIIKKQFDTIYHEHFSYLSLISIENIFSKNGLQVFDVEEYPTHGGSLRIFSQRSDTGIRPISKKLNLLRKREHRIGINSLDFYRNLQSDAEKIKNDLLLFLIKSKQEGRKVAAYGAAAKGNTLLNFSGVRSDLISYVVDENPAKQNMFMPGSRIKIFPTEYLYKCIPDYLIVLPWNIIDEVIDQNSKLKKMGVKFITCVPNFKIEQ